ncbi:MAG TPA: DNA-3-methyladenine glycosylase [Phycisphaerae bacterium]
MKTRSSEALPRSFYDRDVRSVARDVLGRILVRVTPEGLTAGRVVEAEAYLATDDSACHASRGRKPRNAVMFGPPGHAYVYAIHSRWCVNLVTEPEDVPSAVLIRALEPLEGIELMQRRRGLFRTATVRERASLTSGPARLCEALAIDRALNGWDLTRGERLWVAAGQPLAPADIAVSARIGVTSAKDLHLRYYSRSSPFVSR